MSDAARFFLMARAAGAWVGDTKPTVPPSIQAEGQAQEPPRRKPGRPRKISPDTQPVAGPAGTADDSK